MSKIIIHNQTELSDVDAIQHVLYVIVFSYSKERHETMGIGMKELKAINLKVKELRLDRRRR